MGKRKKLYRSSKNKIVFGVCGGLGDFLNINPNIIRVIWGALCLTATGLVAYIVAAIMIPSDKIPKTSVSPDEIGPNLDSKDD